MHFHIVTIFPQMFGSVMAAGVLRRALERRLIEVSLYDLRDFTSDRHRTTDDEPYGGGPGMVMKIEPLAACLDALERRVGSPRKVLLTPSGALFSQQVALRLAAERDLVLICGRYEGVDERIACLVDEELSIGDYVLSGGEIAAMVILDCVTRLVPGVLGNEQSPRCESFVEGLLEYPQYTRPEVFRGLAVPPVLLSGDHGAIQRWRRQESIRRTRERRPDLYARFEAQSGGFRTGGGSNSRRGQGDPS